MLTNTRRVFCLAVCLTMGALAGAQTLPLRSVYYRPTRPCLWKQLADDHAPTGAESPRVLALRTLAQNFEGYAIIKANAVAVMLHEDDNADCGFSYDPVGRPCNLNNGTCDYPAIPASQFSVAQELFISMAARYDLKVIFVLAFSGYHKEMDPATPPTPACPNPALGDCDTFGNLSSPPGAWDFIHSVIDPLAYYPPLMTTGLHQVDATLTDHYTRNYFSDTRIAGWSLGAEWRFSLIKETNFLEKYWDYFWSLVHLPDNAGQFAGMYMIGGPDGFRTDNSNCGNPPPTPTAFSDMKTFFFTRVAHQPDVYGLEWYGSGSYNKSCIAADMAWMVQRLQSDPPTTYPIPADQIFWLEGGSNQIDPAEPWKQFYIDAINAAANLGSRGLNVYDTDPMFDRSWAGVCWYDYLPIQGPWASLFAVNYPVTNDYTELNFQLPVYCGPSVPSSYGFGGYPPPSVGWHNYTGETNGRSTYNLVTGYSFPVTVGPIFFSMATQAGFGVWEAFNAHQ